LHDGILAQLFGLRIRWEFLDLGVTPEQRIQQQAQLSELYKTEKDIRSLSHDLRKNLVLSKSSFINNLQHLLKSKAELGSCETFMACVEREPWEGLEMFITVMLCRIVEEGLQNIIKHAKAKKVWLRLKGDGNHLEI